MEADTAPTPPASVVGFILVRNALAAAGWADVMITAVAILHSLWMTRGHQRSDDLGIDRDL